MIVEPAMMNCGVILPGARLPAGPEGPLPRARRLPRVRRGQDRRDARVRRCDRGLRRRARHHLPGQGDRRRHAVRRDRRDRGALRARSSDGEYDMAGTFNGNPLTMAASRADADRGADARRVRAVQPDRQGDEGWPDFRSIEKYRLPVLRDGPRREGLGHLLETAGPGVPRRGRHRRAHQLLAWLFQQNRGVFKSPWTKQETWTLSVFHTEDDAGAVRRELRGVRGRGRLVSGCRAPRPRRYRPDG